MGAWTQSTISVEWVITELIKNPRIQHKVKTELDHVIGLDHVMTELDFSKLPYLQSKALRVYSLIPLMLPHQANANVKIGGYDILKGITVHINVSALGYDPIVLKNLKEFRPHSS